MSLTSKINNKNELDFQEKIKKYLPEKYMFKTFSGKNSFSSEYELIIENKLENKYNSSLVGLAFDYLVRLIISNFIKNKKEMKNISAEMAYLRLKFILKKDKINFLNMKYISINNKIKKYIDSNIEINKEFVEDICFISRLEQYNRSGKIDYKIFEIDFKEDEDVIIDILELIKKFKKVFIDGGIITENSKVVYNPTFGNSSFKVNGADADIYIDGVIYDFKTSKNIGYSWREVAQLWGYFLLDADSKNNNDGEASLISYKVNKIAFYRARYGEIEYLDIYNYYDKSKIEDAIYCINDSFSNISSEMYRKLKEVSQKYNYKDKKEKSIDNTIKKYTITDLMIRYRCNRYKIMKYITEYKLPVYKENSRYIINEIDLLFWEEERNKYNQLFLSFIFIIIIIIILTFLFLI